MRMVEAEISLLTDPEMPLFIESSIRGGHGYDLTKTRLGKQSVPPSRTLRSLKENIPTLSTQTPTICTASALSRPLPISNFTFLSGEEEIEQLDSSSIPQDGDTGYSLEVDLDYRKYLHREHNSLPLATENIVITRDMRSDTTLEMGKKFNSKFLPQRKLCSNLMDKKKYVLHYTNHQFYINHRMVFRKIHRVSSFHAVSLDKTIYPVQYQETEEFDLYVFQGSVQAFFKLGKYFF